MWAGNKKLYNNGMLSSYKKSTDLSYEFAKNYCAQFSYQSISVQIATHHDLVHFLCITLRILKRKYDYLAHMGMSRIIS